MELILAGCSRVLTVHGTTNTQLAGNRFEMSAKNLWSAGYSTIDAGIGYRTARAEFRLDGRNLTNCRDVVAESEFGDAQYYRMTALTVRAGVAIKY